MPLRKKQPSQAPKVFEGSSTQGSRTELKRTVSEARTTGGSNHALEQAKIYAKIVVLVSLLAVYSNVSQLALSPVFGSIPSSLWHGKLLITGCFVGWAGNTALRSALPMSTTQALPLMAMYVPLIQFFLYRFSDALRPHWGPVAVESLTLLPLAVLTSSSVANLAEDAELTLLPRVVAEPAPCMLAWGLLKVVESFARSHLQAVVGQTFVFTRLGLELLLAAAYTVLAPSRYLIVTLPALMHLALLNPHADTPMATARLNESLGKEGWTLLERQESLTGYISVIENLKQGFRVMRCDHSLLGGNWVRFQGESIMEPIYGVFTMLEAVRLVESEHVVADTAAHALVVGLGIGTTPSAFVSHGINTTVVEIDPVVHEFATTHFAYRQNNPPILKDAVTYTTQLVQQSRTFDYIVHDVFTGGAEPVDLFTVEFLQGLSDLLKPDGVVAINYAGDFTLPAPRTIVRTINEIFPTCRIFRESPINETAIETEGSDFTNMVIFCKKTKAPLTFRPAVPRDFLRSRAREMFLQPKHEVQQSDLLSGTETGVLRKNSTGEMEKWHRTSAVGHWKVMRTVLPATIWELW